VDTREELLYVREDLCRMTASQNRLKDRLQSTDDLIMMCTHLLGCERNKVEKLEKNRAENVTNLAWLACTVVYLRDKAKRLRRTWEDADSLHVDNLTELNRELPFDLHRDLRAAPVPPQATPVPDGTSVEPCRDRGGSRGKRLGVLDLPSRLPH
jgi:hypothetical protein